MIWAYYGVHTDLTMSHTMSLTNYMIGMPVSLSKRLVNADLSVRFVLYGSLVQ